MTNLCCSAGVKGLVLIPQFQIRGQSRDCHATILLRQRFCHLTEFIVPVPIDILQVSLHRHKTPIAASFRDSQHFEVLGDKMFRKKDPKGKA